VLYTVNYLLYNTPIILPANAKQFIARHFLMIDGYVMAQ